MRPGGGRSHEVFQLFFVNNRLDGFNQIARNLAEAGFG
jgi:hypothetical protein